MAITNEEEFNLNDLLDKLEFSDVINGLNEYFTADETRVRIPRSYVEIKSPDIVVMQIVLQPNNPVFQNRFYRFDAEMYLDKIIAWLRTEHGIFYYPGMEAKYAKTERIPPLTERLMDEGALNSLKKLHKRVTGRDPEVDSHTLIADGIAHQVSVYEVQIEELQTQIENQKPKETIEQKDNASDINKLISDYCNKFDIIAPSPYLTDEYCVKYLFSVVDLEREHREAVGKQMVDDYEKYIMDHIRQEASQNGYNLPEKVDGEPLTIERVFHDLLELMRKRGDELRILNSKCNRLDEIVEELNALNGEIKEDLP